MNQQLKAHFAKIDRRLVAAFASAGLDEEQLIKALATLRASSVGS